MNPTQFEQTSLPHDIPGAVDDVELAKAEFPSRLREAFDGATNAEAARRIGATNTTVKPYFEGTRLPIAEILLKISRATGINIHWLLTGRGSRRVEISNAFSKEEEERIRQFAKQRGLTFDQSVRELTLGSLEMLKRF